MIDDCYSLKERDKKGRIVEGNHHFPLYNHSSLTNIPLQKIPRNSPKA